MTLSNSVPKWLRFPPDDRGIILGQSGTGKTTLARVLVWPVRNLLVIDAKHEFVPIQEHSVITKVSELARHRTGAIVWRPEELTDIEDYDRVLKWAYDRTNTLVYIDDVMAMLGATPVQHPRYLRVISRMGRSRRVGLLVGSQQPYSIPSFLLSESRFIWKFYLRRKEDAERSAHYMSDVVLRKHLGHTFWFQEQTMEDPVLARLRLERSG